MVGIVGFVGAVGASVVCSILVVGCVVFCDVGISSIGVGLWYRWGIGSWRRVIMCWRGYCCGVFGLFVRSGEGVRYVLWSNVMECCVPRFGWVVWVRELGDGSGVGGCGGAGGVRAWGLGVGIMYSVGRGE